MVHRLCLLLQFSWPHFIYCYSIHGLTSSTRISAQAKLSVTVFMASPHLLVYSAQAKLGVTVLCKFADDLL
jgi:hypothetical protein